MIEHSWLPKEDHVDDNATVLTVATETTTKHQQKLLINVENIEQVQPRQPEEAESSL